MTDNFLKIMTDTEKEHQAVCKKIEGHHKNIKYLEGELWKDSTQELRDNYPYMSAADRQNIVKEKTEYYLQRLEVVRGKLYSDTALKTELETRIKKEKEQVVKNTRPAVGNSRYNAGSINTDSWHDVGPKLTKHKPVPQPVAKLQPPPPPAKKPKPSAKKSDSPLLLMTNTEKEHQEVCKRIEKHHENIKYLEGELWKDSTQEIRANHPYMPAADLQNIVKEKTEYHLQRLEVVRDKLYSDTALKTELETRIKKEKEQAGKNTRPAVGNSRYNAGSINTDSWHDVGPKLTKHKPVPQPVSKLQPPPPPTKKLVPTLAQKPAPPPTRKSAPPVVQVKLVMAIVHNEDVRNVIDNMNAKGFSVNKLASMGGFLREENATLICEVTEERIPELFEIIEINSKSRRQIALIKSTSDNTSQGFTPYPVEVVVGGATVFVLNADELSRAKCILRNLPGTDKNNPIERIAVSPATHSHPNKTQQNTAKPTSIAQTAQAQSVFIPSKATIELRKAFAQQGQRLYMDMLVLGSCVTELYDNEQDLRKHIRIAIRERMAPNLLEILELDEARHSAAIAKTISELIITLKNIGKLTHDQATEAVFSLAFGVGIDIDSVISENAIADSIAALKRELAEYRSLRGNQS